MRVGAIVLAAGAGTRFGGTKQLAPLDGRPLLEHALAAVAGISPRVVVLGHAADAVRAAVDLHGATPIVCGDWEQGQAASVQAGVHALGDGVDAALVVLGDQPFLTPEALAAIVAAAAAVPEADAVRGGFGGAPGPPVLLRRRLLDRVGELRGDEGFRPLLRDADVRTIALDALADPTDIDTQEELTAR